MDLHKRIHIYCIFVLRTFLTRIFGSHYPREIVELIIMANYDRNRIICGYFHTICIIDKIYVWGSNAKGQLGLGDCEYKNSPQEFNFLKNQILLKLVVVDHIRLL